MRLVYASPDAYLAGAYTPSLYLYPACCGALMYEHGDVALRGLCGPERGGRCHQSFKEYTHGMKNIVEGTLTTGNVMEMILRWEDDIDNDIDGDDHGGACRACVVTMATAVTGTLGPGNVGFTLSGTSNTRRRSDAGAESPTAAATPRGAIPATITLAWKGRLTRC
eukprot:2565269-Rhodomonas_salina.3